MKKLDPCTQLEILDQTYITALDIYKLLPIGKSKSRTIFDQIRADMIRKNIPILPSRPAVIPLDFLLDIYPVNKKRLVQAVERGVKAGEK